MNAKTTEDKALSKIERLQIANQFRILSKLTEDKHDSEHYELSAQIFENGYTSLYFEALHNFSEELSENVSEEVGSGIAKLSPGAMSPRYLKG